MKLTNKYNLPEAIVKAAGEPRPIVEKRIGVTSLITGPLVRHLTNKHWDELAEDVSARLWAIMGQTGHAILENNAPEGAEVEKKIVIERGGWTISSVTDVYNQGLIQDYKWTSVWAVMHGIKPEWVQQLNLYAWLWRSCDYSVDALQLVAFLRDWSKNKARSEDYPNIPFKCIDIPLWSFEKQAEFIDTRLALFDAEPLECTPQEKWQKEDTWAIMKKGRKSALRVLPSKDEAIKYSEQKSLIDQDGAMKNGHTIVFRKGEAIKCKDYCIVNKYCPYYKEK